MLQRKEKAKPRIPLEKKPIARRLVWPEQDESKEESDSGSDATLYIMVNVVFVLPKEYDQMVEVEETEWEVEQEMDKHRPICYYVMNNGCVEEKNAFFERPTEAMRNHLKPLFVREKIREVTINKVLVDCGATVNIIP